MHKAYLNLIFGSKPYFELRPKCPANQNNLVFFLEIYTRLRLYLSNHKLNARLLHYWSVVHLYIDKVHLGTNSKWTNKNTQKFHLIPAYIKGHTSVRKIIQICVLYLNSFLIFLFQLK